jgi:hypothetical protein
MSRFRSSGHHHAAALRFAISSAICVMLGVPSFLSAALAQSDTEASERRTRQAAQYQAAIPKTIFELQPFRESENAATEGPDGRRGTATLVNLSPRINAWFVLALDWGPRVGVTTYHIENPRPAEQTIRLAAAGLQISSGGQTSMCELWPSDPMAIEMGRRAGDPYVALCDGRLYLRNPVRGSQTAIERATDLLRDHVWGGDALIEVVKDKLYRDKFLETGAPTTASPSSEAAHTDWPKPAVLGAEIERPAVPENLGIALNHATASLRTGTWYPARDVAGTYLSFLQPRDIAAEILRSYRGVVNELDQVEASAMAYLIAFDLDEFDLGFAVGSDHPRVGWSNRVVSAVRDDALPGPDGIGTIAPLARTGMVSPALNPRTAAAFTAGFKRQHGAFRYGPLSERNHGSHYGFIEQGAILSKLQPGLATLYVLDDSSVGMKTWLREDDPLLPHIRHARQNGVALIEYDANTAVSLPGALVGRWGPGNWSGSADEKLRSLRAGACLQETPLKRFLIYGYFSAATPSGMARVFQAYGCRYAMLLDMNALEHTYLAVYASSGTGRIIEHLVKGMDQVDKRSDGRVFARFLDAPDDRDFFYLVRREGR